MRRLTVALAVALAGCAKGPGTGTAVTRDSAGVRIVENSGPAWEKANAWTVVDSPLVDIGSKDGDPAYELDQVRGPLRLGDGRLVIANGSTNEIRLYDASGKHIRTSGRAGGGPGEYQSIMGIWLGPGDSLLVGEPVQRRMSVLDREGNFLRVFSFGGQGGQLMPVAGKVELALPLGWFGDGSVAGVSQAFAINQARSGAYRDTVTVIRYGSDGTMRDTLGRFPSVEMESMTINVAGQSISAPTPVPLGKQTAFVVAGEHLFVVLNNTWEIEIRGLDGKLLALARAPATPVKLTPSDIAAHRKEQIHAMGTTPMVRNLPDALKKQVTAHIEQTKYPATLPFFAGLLTDTEGNVWAQEATPPTQKSQRFVVVDSTGRWLGVVTMPADFRPTFIGSNAVYGVWKDEEDVERLRGYALKKP